MFEIIGILMTIYLFLGAIAFCLLCVQGEAHDQVNNIIADHRWGELVFVIVFTIWCWPLPLLEHFGNR
jgi:hypothetical protein